jgi:putative transposase
MGDITPRPALLPAKGVIEVLDETTREQMALFRYGLIADLVQRHEDEKGLYRLLHEKAQRQYVIPGSQRTRVAVETIRDWLQAFRRGGFEALRPQVRSDQGRARAIPQAVADLLCQIKEDEPDLSVHLVIDRARAQGIGDEVVLAPSTVHRHLAHHGLMDKQATEPTSKDRRRFAFDKAGELWMSDVMHGPAVKIDGGRKHKTYLVGIIDDATRLVPYAAFTLAENTTAFLPVLAQAVLRRGVPKRLYVDNGSVFRSHHLALVCAKLGVHLIHARPFQPQGKGKQERWFRSVRTQLLPTLSEHDLGSLEALNRRLWAWIEGEYHHAPHRGLDGATPLDRWTTSAGELRLFGDARNDLDEIFLFEQKRKVQKDRTVSLKGVVYEVDAMLVGKTVTLRYDPSRRGRPIDIYCDGQRIQQAKPVDLYANCFVKRDHTTKALRPDRRLADPPVGLPLRELSRGKRED